METFKIVAGAIKVLEIHSKKGRVVKVITDTIEVVSAALHLLNSDCLLDDTFFDKMTKILRYSLKPLYTAFPIQALKLSATVFAFLFPEKVEPQITAGNKALQAKWERVADSLLSGVLDYIEENNNDMTFALIASTLFPTLCRICFSPVFNMSIANVTSGLKATAFSLLSESAQHNPNRVRLRNSDLLGGKRIGNVFYGCKEYLALESLVYLISRLLSLKVGSAAEKLSLLKDIFDTPCPDQYNCAEALISLFQQPAKIGSDDLLSNTLDILAKCNIFFPQPFELKEINACGVLLRQDFPHERLIIDYHGFFANIPLGDDQYDTFRIPYPTVHQITFSLRPDPSFTEVTIQTTSLPEYGSRSMERPKNTIMATVFDLCTADVERFKEALDVRGMSESIRRNQVHKPQVRISVAPHTRLEFEKDGNPVSDPPSFQEKVSTLGRAMKLDDPSEEFSDVESPGELAEVFKTPLHSISQHLEAVTIPLSDSSALAVISAPLVTHLARAAKLTPKTHLIAPPRAPSQFKIIQKSVFGDSEDELSEISDDDADSLKALSQKYQKKQATSNSGTLRAPRSESRTVLLEKRRVVDSDDEKLIIATKKSTSSSVRKKVIIVEDSDEDMDKKEVSREAAGQKSNKDSALPVAGLKTRLPSSGRIGSVSPISSPVDDHDVESELEKLKNQRDQLTLAKSRDIVPAKKRKRKQNEHLGDVEDLPVAKRLRSRTLSDHKPVHVEDPTDSQVLKKPRTVVAHKYGNKKGRTSSPAPFPTSVVKPDENCDEVSTALEISEDSPPHKTKKKTDITPAADKAFSGVATRTRAAAMKNKKNEIAPAPVVKVTKRAAPKAKPNPAQFVSQARKKSMPEQSKETKEELQSNSSSASPQLMRPNVPMEVKDTKAAAKVSKKKQSAPWETTDFNLICEPDFESTVIIQEPVGSIADDTLFPVSVEDALPSINLASKVPALGALHAQDGTERNDKPNMKDDDSLEPVEAPASSNIVTLTASMEKTAVIEVRRDTEVTDVVPATEEPKVDTLKPKSSILNRTRSPPTEEEVRAEDIQKVARRSSSHKPEKYTIDLTQESPKLKNIEPAHQRVFLVPSVQESVGERTFAKTLLDKPKQYKSPEKRRSQLAPTHTAKFATPILKEVPKDFGGGMKNLFVKPNSDLKASFAKPKSTPRLVVRSMQEEDPASDEESSEVVPEMRSIINVLNEMNAVMIDKVFGKLNAVKENATVIGSIILNNAVGDLQNMHVKVATQYNGLIDLEAAYATRGRRIIDAYEENVKINEELCHYMHKKLEDHDRHSLVRKMPKMLTTRPIPRALEKYVKK